MARLRVRLAGTRLSLSGRVLTRDCTPVVGVRLDFWQADATGALHVTETGSAMTATFDFIVDAG